MRGRLWTDAERTRAAEMRASGMEWHAIGAVFGATGDGARGAAKRVQSSGTNLGSERATAPASPRPPEADFDEKRPQPLQPIGPPVHTSKTRAEAYLCVPDLQAPFHEPKALDFCERVRREFGVPKDNIIILGDEADNFHGKGFDKPRDPDAEHTPRQELAAAVDELKRWYAAYPMARVCESNHGTRYDRRAADAEISSQWMRLYRDVIEAPPGWEWRRRWIIRGSKQHFLAEHGHEGKTATEGKVLEHGYSTVHGHFTGAVIRWVSNHLGRRLWGMCAGALIDYDTYAFRYAKKYARRPDMGVSVVLDGGRLPIWVPFYE